jgi:GTP-binding protein
MQSTYITSAQRAEQLPDLGGGPELAFVGRSNCGKSSLLNALLGRQNLARTSSTPGRTQMVNFFAVEKGGNRLILADLPGYGFSAIGKDVRRFWQDLVNAYLLRRELKDVLFLLDVRRAHPLDDEDFQLLKMLAGRRPRIGLSVVLTKSDKASTSEVAKAVAGLKKTLAEGRIPVARICPVSSLKGKGIEELQRALLEPTLAPSGTEA